MQTKVAWPKWASVIAVAGALLSVILLSGLRPPTGPDGIELINNDGHYNQVNEEAYALVKGPFGSADAGLEVTDADRESMRKAIKLFTAMNTFRPTKVGPFLGAAKAYALLGETEDAERCLQQILNNAPLYEKDENGKLVANEARYVLSGLRFKQGKFEEAYAFADEAVKAMPKPLPHYYVRRASAAVQIRQVDQAKEDVARALQLDSGNQEALQLAILLKTQESVSGSLP